MFIGKLLELSGGEPSLIGNKTLQRALDWDDDRYKRIRSELQGRNEIIRGKGQGGSVGIADKPGTGPSPLKAFISYSHVDEELKSGFVKHLEPLRRSKLIDSWSDREIKAGEEWDKQISKNLETANFIFLLVSIDFINSAYCYDVELEKAIERHSKREAIVIPIILRSCIWKGAPFAKLQALPSNGKPVSLWPDRDEAFMNVAEGIRDVIEQMNEE
ncbi:MAG: toll/interleukin-1 receptor domain-containing protein [Acidobacteriaceae bacterium]